MPEGIGDQFATMIDEITQRALGTDGVAGLHGGPDGTIATYLPGRTVAGIRVCEAEERFVDLHLVMVYGADIAAVAHQVRVDVEALTGLPTTVTIEDLTDAIY